MKILICADISENTSRNLRAIPRSHLDVKPGISPEELLRIIPDFDAVVVRSGTRITEDVINAGTNLKVIARAGMGYDNVDVGAATRRGVVVMNTPGSNATTTAEHALAMMLALARNVPQAHLALHQGKWDRKSYVGTELCGKTLGVVGLGNVGSQLAKRARGLEMEVLAFDPHIPERIIKQSGALPVSLEELWARSDFISLHAALNDATHHLINAESLHQMKPGMRLVNCARGGLVDEEALYRALQEGKIAGAALDVFEKEPLPTDHPLLNLPEVITTPHLGASTTEAQEQVWTAISEQLRTFFVDGLVVNGVNTPSIGREVLAVLGRYIDLAGCMGRLLAQLPLPPFEEVRVECSGEITKHDLSPVTSAALSGMMSQFSSQPVNLVNAAFIAKERGIQVIEARSADPHDYVSLVTVSVRGGDQTYVVSGSILGKDKSRLVRFNDFYTEVVPKGYLLMIENEDKPGVIGAWGTVLGKHAINISRVQVALDENEAQAFCIINIDAKAPPEVIEELRAVTNIRSVHQVLL